MLRYAQAQSTMDATLNMLLKTPSRNPSTWSTFLLLKKFHNNMDVTLTMLLNSSGKRSVQIRPVFRTKNYGAPMVWNEPPLDVRSTLSIDIFKNRLKTFFI